MKRELGFHPEYQIDLHIKVSYEESPKQIEDVKALMKEDLDLLIISPNEAAPLTPIVEEAYDQGIPVIIIDRKISSEKYTAYIGGDNYTIGKQAGEFAAQLLHGQGNIVNITGLMSSSPAEERSQGFVEIIDSHPDIHIIETIDGLWSQTKAMQELEQVIQRRNDIDLIYAANDIMALGAYETSQSHDLHPHIIGVDGLNTPSGGIDLVLEGKIEGTFLYPTGGGKAIQLALDILEGKDFQRINNLSTIRIDQTNARTMKLQTNQIEKQQARVDFQKKQLGELAFLLKKQQTFLFLGVIICCMLIAIIGLTFYHLYKKSKAHEILNIKNQTIGKQTRLITNQRDKLLRFVRMDEEDAEIKTRFFNNISHEFRQALSLIVHPINRLVETERSPEFSSILRAIQQNLCVLARLSEEVLDFEKVGRHHYQLMFKEVDLATLIQTVIHSYLPRIENEKLTFTSSIPKTLPAYVDPSVIEKVLSNLMSNAIKYNQEGGSIHIEVKCIHQTITIAVSDTGIGIAEKDLPNIFHRYYRAGHLHNDIEGYGLGLAICYKLIQLHRGHIKAYSTLGEGSTFYFTIPQHKSRSVPASLQVLEGSLPTPSTSFSKAKILVVEDNPEIRTIISDCVGRFFEVVQAQNGQEGLELINKDMPDLVVSDIYMPGIDGIELCQQLKSNPLTFHIPVILLTAVDSEDSKIQGFEIGADSYVTKPFNERVLLSQIQNLILSRQQLKESFQGMFNMKGIVSKKEGKDAFVEECLKIIHENGSNETFNLDQLASHMNLSRSSLYRKIKEYTGIKPVEFMRKGKLNFAAKLLLTTDMTVSEVAFESGYNDTKYFSRCFRQEYGNVPSRFKQLANSN